ncbi:MAG: hypothetical protein K8U03_20715 [Planctomycetia bacterium]|nr:hypothetical protein [Planctomycetia bacterium]
MNKQQAERWAATQAKGRSRFIWIFGVLMWGPITGLSWAVAMSAIQGWGLLRTHIPIGLLLFPIGGYFFGAWIWKRNEAEYQKYIGQSNAK